MDVNEQTRTMDLEEQGDSSDQITPIQNESTIFYPSPTPQNLKKSISCISKNEQSTQNIMALECIVLNHNKNTKTEDIQSLVKKQKRKIKIQKKIIRAKSISDQQQQLVSTKEYSYQPYGLNMNPPQDYFVFGEIVLEGDYYNNPYNLDKTYEWSYWKKGFQAYYLKDINCVTLEMTRRVDTVNNFEQAIQQYLNTPDQQIHLLGELLQQYSERVKTHVQIMKEKNFIIDKVMFQEQLLKLSNEYYQNCLKWMKTKVNNNELYMYVFYEIDLKTADQNFKYNGYSQGLLDLIGLNENTAIPYILRKGRLEYIDSISRLKRLIHRLYHYNIKNNKTDIILDHDIITVDDYQIPAHLVVYTPEFQCLTPENFQYYDYFFGGFKLQYSQFRLFKYEVNPKIIESIKLQRMKLSPDPFSTVDFEYSLMSEMFIDKFYKQSSIEEEEEEQHQEQKEDLLKSTQELQIQRIQ